jgi:hypothetical protein
MFQKNDLKAFVNGVLQHKSNEGSLPYWINDAKTMPLKEVVVVNNPINIAFKKPNITFYTQNSAFNIKIMSPSYNGSNK